MNRSRFTALYREHYPRVLGLCRRMLGGADDAEDAAQEAFARGYRAIGRFRAGDDFGAWIGTIATRHCIDVLRRRRRLAAVFVERDDAQEPVDPTANGVAPLLRAADAAAVARSVDALPDRYRVPLVLAYYRDASYAEIAAALGISRNHVGVLVLRGKQRLRRALEAQNEEN